MEITLSASRSDVLVVLRGSHEACPKGCADVADSRRVPVGTYYVKFVPSEDTGRWKYVMRDRPWCVALKGADGHEKENSSFTTIDDAVKRAKRLQRRMAS